MLMYLGVEDVSGVTTIFAVGIHGVVALGFPSVVALMVLGRVALGIHGVVAFVFNRVFSLGHSISLPVKVFF